MMISAGNRFQLKERLTEKSIEAYVLSLETINRLSIQYRLETFCILFCIAWELLIKAKIISDSGRDESVFYPRRKEQTKRSLTLRDCLKTVFPNQRDPSRRNIERIEELRDASVHLVIGRIPRDVICLFQAGVINYHRHLSLWFGKSLSDRFPVGMMNLVFDMSPEQGELNSPRLQQQLGPDAAAFLLKYCADLREESDELQRATEFLIPIGYRLVLTKRDDDADISLTSGPTGKKLAGVVESPKDSGRTHPFLQTDVVEEVNKLLQVCINKFDIQCICKVLGASARREYFYRGTVRGSPGQYSQEFVDWIANRHRQDHQFFEKMRKKAKEMR